MIYNARVTLYLYFDSKITLTRQDLESKFYYLAHQRLDNICVDDLYQLLMLCHRLDFLQTVYLDLQSLF